MLVTLTLKITTAQVVEVSVTVRTTDLFRTTFIQTIILNLLMKRLLGFKDFTVKKIVCFVNKLCTPLRANQIAGISSYFKMNI